ncbi:MAG: hypothetical protein ACI8P0_005199 [Planctomycetaceae bacterium]|jgi:hypothetical protein
MTENHQPTENNNPDESGWVECPTGEISGMVGRLTRQRKLVASAKVSGIAAALLIGAVIWQSLPGDTQQAKTPDGEFQFGEICCSEVTQYAAAFNKGELDEEKTAQISQHIAKCPHCGPEFEKNANHPQASLDRLHGRISTASLAHSGVLVALVE